MTTTIDVKDAAGSTVTVARVPALGRKAVADSLPVVAASMGARVSATITRPANTTAYSANDVVGGVLTFSAVATTGGTATIMGADLMWDFGAIPTGMSSYTLHLYSVTPPSAYSDNGAWDLPSGDRASYIGNIVIGTPADLGSTLFVNNDLVSKVVQLGGSETALYGYLVTSAGYTPAATSETGSVRLRLYSGM